MTRSAATQPAALPRAAHENLERSLSLRHFVAIGINVCIGGSIYLVGADVYRLAGAWSLVIAGAVGGFSIIMALIVAEVSSRFDRTGGAYIQARTAFGPFWGFEVAWMLWFTRVLAQSSLTNGIVTSVAYFTAGGSVPQSVRIGGILVTTVGITLLHLRKVEQGARTIMIFAVCKLLPLAAVLAVAAARGVLLRPVKLGEAPTLTGAATVALLLVFSFSGYEVIPVTAGEGRNPRRDAPLATLICVIVLVCVWMLLHLTLIDTVPDLGSQPRPVAASATLLMGERMGALVNIGAIVSALGTCIGSQLTASRTLFAAAGDGLVPSWFAAVSTGQRVPHHAILFSSLVVLVMSLSGSFLFLAAAAAIPRLFVFFLTAAALIRLRQRPLAAPTSPTAFVLPFGPVLAVAAMLSCLLILAGVTLQQLSFGFGGFVAGALLYSSVRS